MTNTRKLAYIAILSAVSFLLLYFSFPLIPAADFLKVDFSILPVLIALVIFDFKSAIGVLLLRSLLKLLLNNGGPGSMIGLPMNFVALGVFVWGLSYFWKKNQTSKNYILGSVLGTILLTVAMVVLNYIYASTRPPATQTWKSSSGKHQETANLCFGKWLESDGCRRS